jgi:hypothetical protein
VAVGNSDPFIPYHKSFGPGQLQEANFEILVVVSRAAGDDEAQAKLDSLVAEAIPDALYADGVHTVGCLFAGGATPAAESVYVEEASAYQPLDWGDLKLLACRISVQVTGRHS